MLRWAETGDSVGLAGYHPSITSVRDSLGGIQWTVIEPDALSSCDRTKCVHTLTGTVRSRSEL